MTIFAKAYHRLNGRACPNFVGKTFAGGSKTAKFVNIFSLESFALYGVMMSQSHTFLVRPVPSSFIIYFSLSKILKPTPVALRVTVGESMRVWDNSYC